MLTATAIATGAAVAAVVVSGFTLRATLRQERAQRKRWVEEDSRLPEPGKASFEVRLKNRSGPREWGELVIRNRGQAPFDLERILLLPRGSAGRAVGPGALVRVDDGGRIPAPVQKRFEGGAIHTFYGVRLWAFEENAATFDGLLQFHAAGAVFEVEVEEAAVKATPARKVPAED